MSFELPDLPYARTALEPHVSAASLDAHRAIHQDHVDTLNRLLPGSGLDGLDLPSLLRRAQGRLAEAAAESWNHAFFWTCLAPRAGGEPRGALAALLARRYGDFAGFRAEFGRMALSLAGPGWAWLVQRPDGSAGIVVTHGAATPAVGGDNPLLACDLWEHAHWIDHHDDRAAWLASFWKVVDWDAVARRLR
ncbi:Superoxide dismutase [Pseudoxanthomonas suwonensis 11-1]|uniref:Superoxide dismutase n=1 Tax=Pseudoxanthomonas suwonensis (strain 11-1) TaxID=743721 RepID=E6WR21_PSEUU|nr:Fe-Mn family superoxide dismutase [Pseudoxanthomonas suwonensis]ADV26693.1 Superoxide dismutase [Pseudoxanthomonas suwonensis 11-1]